MPSFDDPEWGAGQGVLTCGVQVVCGAWYGLGVHVRVHGTG